MTVEYRALTLDDYEQANYLEAKAFYNRPSADGVELMRQFFPPDWTVGAFVDGGKLVSDVRTVPQVRRMHGAKMAFGAVGPVTCLAPYRRQGHVGRLLVVALERMRERGQVLSGLYTPHDALYRRYGWERAEFKKRYQFRPKDVKLRFRGAKSRIDPVSGDDWQRLDTLFREKTRNKNGPFVRIEVWWREVVLRHYEDNGSRSDNDAVVWVDDQGRDQGYAIYMNRALPTDGRWTPQEIWIRDFVALTSDAYLGLWQHMLTHDLASSLVWEPHPDDRLIDLLEDPFKVRATITEGAMIRIVDLERAIGQRPYVGDRPAEVIIHIGDESLPWNAGTWRITAAEGRMEAERTDAGPDAQMSVNALAPLFTGYVTPEVAACSGFITVLGPEALAEMSRLFAVADPPYTPEFY